MRDNPGKRICTLSDKQLDTGLVMIYIDSKLMYPHKLNVKAGDMYEINRERVPVITAGAAK